MSEDILNIERIESYKASDLYKDDVLETLVANVEGHVKNLTFDVNEQKGRDQIASIAYSVSRIKTTLETKRKSLTEGYRAEIDKINKRGNAVKERLQTAQDNVRKPLTEWETKQKERLEDLKTRMAKLESITRFDLTPASADLEQAILDANALYQYDWQEFQSKADQVYDEVKPKLQQMLEEAKTREANEAELARLRKAEEDRLAKEAEEAKQKEIEDRIRKQEQERIEREQAEKDKKAQEERERLQREASEAKERAEKAERDKIAAEAKAQAEKELAARQERERIEKEAADKKAEEERREANKRHVNKIHKEISEDIFGLMDNDVTDDFGKSLVTAIANGQIRHLKIIY